VYEVLLLPLAQKDLDKLAAPVFNRLVKKIRDLRKNTRPPGSLKLTSDDGYRIDDTSHRVYIYRIKHRKDAYQ